MSGVGRARNRPRRVGRLVVGFLLVGLCALLSPTTAYAAPEPQWWYSYYSVDGLHAQGLSGEGQRIAVIDAQINPDLPVFAGANLTVEPDALCAGTSPVSSVSSESSRHGSTVTGMLVGNGQGAAAIRGMVPKAEVVFIGWGDIKDGCEKAEGAMTAGLSAFGWGIRRALDAGATIISTSVTGSGNLDDNAVVAEAIARGVPIVGGIPNGVESGGEAPWMLNGTIAVAATDTSGALALEPGFKVPNKNSSTTVAAAGVDLGVIGSDAGWDASLSSTGSSFATPIVAAMLALTAQKYPTATGNQLIQSLIHNTGVDDHPLTYLDDGLGYGLASPAHMLRVDPTQYPDENPLMGKASDEIGPSQKDLAAAEARLASPPPSPEASDGTEPVAVLPIAVGVVIGVVVLAIIVIVLIVIVRRRGSRAQ